MPLLSTDRSGMATLWRGLLLLVLGACCGCSREPAPPVRPAKPPASVSLCQGGILAVLPTIAREKGLFAAEGLDVTLNIVGDGKIVMEDLLADKCDLALTGEFPVARQSFDRSDLAIIATLAVSDNGVKILARRDRGITSPRNLAGKRVGVSKGTISNFFLDQFLKKNRIPRDGLTVIGKSHRDLPMALQRGEIDAYAGSDVAYFKGKQLLGAGGVTFSEPGLTNHTACLTVKREWLAANQHRARGVLRALLRAEQELARQPSALMPQLAAALQITPDDLQSLLAEQQNRVGLDQVLLLALEDESRWMQETGMVSGKEFPNHLRLLEPGILRELAPAAVELR